MNSSTEPTAREKALAQLAREKREAEHELANAESVAAMRRCILEHIERQISNWEAK